MPQYMAYNPDRFVGTLSKDGQSLKVLQNDDGMAVDHPVDFIRVQ